MSAPVFSDIREQVMVKLRLDPDDAPLVDYWMRQAYADVAQQSGFEWAIGFTSVPLVSGSGQMTLPCEVAWIRHIRMAYTGGLVSRPSQQVRMEEVLTKQQLDSAAGAMEDGLIYAVAGQFDVVFWPLAQAGQRAQIQHTVLPEDLSDDDAPAIAEPYGSKLLEYGALVEGAKFKKDPLMSDFELSYQMWMSRYISWLNRRKGASSTAFEVWSGSQQIDRIERESEHWSWR